MATLAPDSPYMLARMEWAELQEELVAANDNRRLDLSDMPKFGGQWQRSLGASLEVMMPGLLVMLLIFAVAVMLTFMRFLRYDPC